MHIKIQQYYQLELTYYYNTVVIGMSFFNTPKDDYLTDIKPQQPFIDFSADISDLAWASNGSPLFAVTSWDGQLRVYQVISAFKSCLIQQFTYKFGLPILKCAWNDQCTQIFVGLLDGTIKYYDFQSNQVIEVARQNGGISSLHFVSGTNAIVSSGYEAKFNIWQIGNSSPVMTIATNDKIYTSHFQYPFLAAGLANQKVIVVDITNELSKTIFDSSQLGKNSLIQSIAINHNKSIMGIASFDGRANISSINKTISGTFSNKSIITFKSNKHEENGETLLYPINSVGFNPRNDRWIMTAGSDGAMHFWDYEAKNKIKTLNYLDTPICVARVNTPGDMVAYALGNDWHLGEEGIGKWPVKIGVHLVTENEVKYNK